MWGYHRPYIDHIFGGSDRILIMFSLVHALISKIFVASKLEA